MITRALDIVLQFIKRAHTAYRLSLSYSTIKWIILLTVWVGLLIAPPAHSACPGDVNDDGAVNALDLAAVANQLGRIDCPAPADCRGDIDSDNDVDGSDLQLMAQEIGRTDYQAAPSLSVSLSPEAIVAGETAVLAWTSTDADTCTIDQNIGNTGLSGAISVSHAQTTTYTVTAQGPGGSVTESVTLSVAVNPPSVNITASAETIVPGETVTLTWDTIHADACTIMPDISNVPLTGSREVSPTKETIYTITAVGSGVTASDQVTIKMQNPSAMVINTIAGNGTRGHSGDGGPAVMAEIDPYGVITDDDGNLYINEIYYIRKVTPNGVITTIAGTGRSGYSGDDGPAISAQIRVSEIASDGAGNLYLFRSANTGSSAYLGGVRKIDTAGTIATAFDAETAGVDGDLRHMTVDTAGNVYFSVFVGYQPGEPAHQKMIKVDPDSNVTWIAGNGSPEFIGDGGPAVDAGFDGISDISVAQNGDLYILTNGEERLRVRKIDSQGIISTVAGGGQSDSEDIPALDADIGNVSRIVSDASGNLYLLYPDDQIIKKVNNKGIITTVAGKEGRLISELPGDIGMVDQDLIKHVKNIGIDPKGNWYLTANASNNDYTSIRKVSSPSAFPILISSPVDEMVSYAPEVLVAGKVRPGYTVNVNGIDAVVVDDMFHAMIPLEVGVNHVLAEASASGSIVGYDAVKVIHLNEMQGIIETVAGGGEDNPYLVEDLPAVNANLHPRCLALDDNNTVYMTIGSGSYNGIFKVGPDGILTRVAGTRYKGFSGDNGLAIEAQLDDPTDIVLDADGVLYFVDAGNYRIRAIDAEGIITTVAGTGETEWNGRTGAALDLNIIPQGLELDPDGNLLIADTGHYRILKMDPSGSITYFMGQYDWLGYDQVTTGEYMGPYGLDVSPDGQLYIADNHNQVIWQTNWYGDTRTQFAGRYCRFCGRSSSYSGGYYPPLIEEYGADAAQSYLGTPTYVAVGDDGAVYILEKEIGTIRKVDTDGKIYTLAGALENCRLSVYDCPYYPFVGDGGPAQLAQLRSPYGIAVSADDTVYYTDNGRVRRIRKVSPTTFSGRVTDTASGSPIAGAAVSANWFGVVYTTLTAGDGSFSFENIHAVEGNISFVTQAPGYAAHRVDRTAMNGSLDRPLDIALSAPPELELALYYPTVNAQMTTTLANVKGTISHAARVTVNGILADMDGLIFSAAVPLPVEGANTLTIEVRDAYGQEVVLERQVTRTYQEPTVQIQASAAEINLGDPVTLEWQASNAASVTIDQGIGNVEHSGSWTFIPEQTSTYTITATNPPATVTASVTVSVSQDEPIRIQFHPETIRSGDTTTLTWSCSEGYRDVVTISRNYGDVSPAGSMAIDPGCLSACTYALTITATGSGGTEQATASVVVVPVSAPEILIDTDPHVIEAGSPATLNWRVAGADTISIDQGIGSVDAQGTVQLWPLTTTTYTLTAQGSGGTRTQQATVEVAPRPVITIGVNPAIVPSGGQATLTWNADHADRCAILPGIGDVAPSGSIVVSPQQTTDYTITAYGPGGISIDSVELTVADEPTATLTADEIIIDSGGSAILSWLATNARQRTITPDIGAVAFNGSALVQPARTTLYTLTATGDGGTAHAYVRVHVRGNDPYGDPTPAEQAHIEAINRARANPADEAARLGIDLNEGLDPGTLSNDPLPPLACSAQLLEAAWRHSRDMLDNQYYDHDSQDGRTISDRIQETGFDLQQAAENLDQQMTHTTPIEEVPISLAMHDRLFVDAGIEGRGHRRNILNADLKEVGIGISRGSFDGYAYGALLTCDFATRSDGTESYVLGVVYDDLDGDGRYTAGEGIGNVEISIPETADTTFTASAGGYRIPLDPGQYTLEADLPDGRSFSKSFTMPAHNVKVDFDLTPLRIIDLSVSPQGLAPGETATLAWQVSGASTCAIDQGIGTVALEDSVDVTPSASTTYTLTATGEGGTISRSITLWLDTEAPTASEITPANGASVNSPSGQVTVTVTVADNESGLCSATLLDNQGSDVSHLLTISGATVSWPADIEGALDFTLVVEDCAGNIADIPVAFTAATAPEGVDFGLDGPSSSGAEFVGGPIRITNGNMVESRADLAMASPNPLALRFDAYFNSRSSRLGDLGYGWTHTYSVNLADDIVIDGQTYIRIAEATGRSLYFNADAPYAAAFNEKSRLFFENGQFIWHRRDGARYGFTAEGRLDWVDDAVGNRLELVYSADRLDTVTDTASGRTLTFAYDGNLISAITGPATQAVPDGIWVSFGQDGHQNLETVTYADGSGIIYTYDDPNDPNNLTLKENSHGHELARWSYNDQDRAVGSTLPDGTGVAIDYPGDDQVHVTDAYGVQRTYTLTQIGRRTKVTAMQGPPVTPYSAAPVVRWQYDDRLNLQEVEWAGGTSDSPMHTIHRYENFDARGNPQTIIRAWNTPEEQVVTYTYHPDMDVVLTRSQASVVDSSKLYTTLYDYDDPSADGDDPQIHNQAPTGRVHRIIQSGLTRGVDGGVEPFVYTTAMTYNPRGQVLTTDGPLNGTTDTITNAYDPTTGDFTSVTRPLVGTTVYGDHDAAGQPGFVTDINDVTTTLTYDGRGRVIETENQANGAQTIKTYNQGLLEQTTDPDGITRTYTYDPDYGRLDTATDHQGNSMVYGYDSQGNRTDIWRYAAGGSEGAVSRQHWSYQHPDQPGLLHRTLTPAPNGGEQDVYTEYDYDLAGNPVAVTDPKGAVTQYVYDELNRTIEVLEPGDGLTIMEYDAHGNLAAVINAENHTTTYEYDDLGRRVTEISPDTGATRFRYDAVGSLIGSTDGRGVATTFTPDVLGRTRQIDFPYYDGLPAYSITYTYDTGVSGKGRLTAMEDAAGTTTWDYSQFDTMGRLSKTTQVDNFTHTVSQTLTPGGRITRLTYPSGRVVDYQRSQCTCDISSMSTTYDGQETVLAADMAYQAFGPTKAMDIGETGSANVNNRYGESGLLHVANPDTPNARKYIYDANGNQLNIKMTATPWQSQTYTYDHLNRVETAAGAFGTAAFTYDKIGNHLTRTQNGRSRTYTYVPGTNRLDRISPAGSDPIVYGYDGHGNTTTIGDSRFTYNQNNRLVAVEDDNTLVAGYVYNGLGQRAVKRVDGVNTYFHYDLDGKMIFETTDNLTMASGTEHIYRGKGLHAQVDVETGMIHFYHTNYLGAVHQLTDSGGTMVWEAVYHPYGQATVHAGSTAQNNWRMPGQYFDAETGLYYNYFRYYDTETGRYLTPDPIGLEGGINPYVYVKNNPLNNIDPYGLSDECSNARSNTYTFVEKNGDVVTVYNDIDIYAIFVNGELVYAEENHSMMSGAYRGVGALGGAIVGRIRLKVKAGVPKNVSKIKNGPKFPNLKDHAKRHSNLHPDSYYNKAVEHTKTGKQFKVRHDGQTKYAYVTRTGEDSFTFTSTSKSGKTIFTHMDNVNTQYLRNKGITLPESF